MNVTRDVILDLMPVYLSGDASSATRQLVDDYLAGDAELARWAGEQRREFFDLLPSAGPAPEIELRSITRTRRLLGVQRWLFGLGWFFFASTFSSRLTFRDGQLVKFNFLFQENPLPYVISLLLAIACWVSYGLLRVRRSSRRRLSS